MPAITKRFLDAIKGDGKLHIIADNQLQGFCVQVTPIGRVSFCISYRIAGKQTRRVIGRYGPVTVEQARRQAFAELGRLKFGENPHLGPPPDVATLEALYEAWMERHVVMHLKPSTARNYQEMWRAHLKPRLASQSPTKITYAAVGALHAEMKATPTAANRLISALRAMLAWAEGQRMVKFADGNPARGHRRYKESPRERFLSVPEIRIFITGLARAPMDEMTRRALLLELLLAQRSGEIAQMRKGDIDLKAATWIIPAHVMKSNNTHTVPLPPWARRIIGAAIAEARGMWVFPSPVGDPTARDAQPMDRHACSKALSRAQRPQTEDGELRPRRKTDIWVYDFRDRADAPNPITPHDLRRTASSYLELLGYSDVIRGAILDHADSRNVTAKHYSAAELLKLKRTALLDWEAALRQIMAGDDPFSTSIEDDRAEEARKLGVNDPDNAPLPTDMIDVERRV